MLLLTVANAAPSHMFLNTSYTNVACYAALNVSRAILLDSGSTICEHRLYTRYRTLIAIHHVCVVYAMLQTVRC
jgi:hypothetical protein